LSESAFALIREAEERKARALGRGGRRTAGVYYTPASLAAQVLEIALEHGSVRSGRVLDPCAGAGAFLVAAARAGFRDVGGLDLDRDALRVARSALKLCGIARPSLRRADSLRFAPRLSADLLVSNPPYGHVESVRERRFLARVLPALQGGEIDRYAAFILRSLQLVRPGGTAALLVPDTWMFLARAGALREAILTQAEVAALVDLGKPFVSAKDTRVQALVLVRRPWKKNN
jgi:type I restriction-modification system DNA methylase subunit